MTIEEALAIATASISAGSGAIALGGQIYQLAMLAQQGKGIDLDAEVAAALAAAPIAVHRVYASHREASDRLDSAILAATPPPPPVPDSPAGNPVEPLPLAEEAPIVVPVKPVT